MQINYDRQCDRLIGADTFQSINGKSIKSLLMSYERAMSLKTMLDALLQAHPDAPPARPPFPQVLALIEPGIAFSDSAELPAKYNRLLQVVTVVPDATTLKDRPLQTAEEQLRFAGTLFGVLRQGHDAALVFGNEGRCTSIVSDCITPGGEFVDVYYLDSTVNLDPEEIRKRKVGDLTAALRLAWEVGGSTAFNWRTMLRAAITAYLAAPLSDYLDHLSGDACGALAVGGPEHADVIFAEIAGNIYASIHGQDSSN
ncbi:hypothetical protein SAMN05446935_7631 [Burkholderia sp. YR290]|nr:hypothetical protein SAMN05446935_7631 [Burkholderia sp. YR290]